MKQGFQGQWMIGRESMIGRQRVVSVKLQGRVPAGLDLTTCTATNTRGESMEEGFTVCSMDLILEQNCFSFCVIISSPSWGGAMKKSSGNDKYNHRFCNYTRPGNSEDTDRHPLLDTQIRSIRSSTYYLSSAKSQPSLMIPTNFAANHKMFQEHPAASKIYYLIRCQKSE